MDGPQRSPRITASCPAAHLVEGVEVPLPGLLQHDPRLLQQVVGDVAADRVVLKVEVDIHVLAEAGRVVVPVRLGVAERLQNRVGLNQHALYPEGTIRLIKSPQRPETN